MTSPTQITALPEPERTLPGHRIRVTMEGGEQFVVRVSNRDRVAWDKTAPRHKWGSAQEVPWLAGTFLAWSAAYREGLTDLKFDAFEKACEDCEDVAAADDDDARPTR